MMPPTIFDYIKSEEKRFDNDEIQVGENWYWNFRNHVQLIFHLKHGRFFQGVNNYLRAFKNIFMPMLNLAYWTEDIEVKDVVFFIEGQSSRALSFLLKKYHDEVYVREHNLDTLFDQIAESDLDYGGVLVQKSKKGCPEVLPLTKVAFCDQTDIMGSPIGFRYNFGPETLRGMAKYGWGDPKNGATTTIDDLIIIAGQDKEADGVDNQKNNHTPGKQIEVYIVRGSMPVAYLNDDDDMENFENQLQIVAFYTNKNNEKQGVTLYRKKESESSLKFFTSQEVPGRALGYGEGEALVHPQIWTNFLEIHKMQLIEAASKVPLWTDDENYTTKNKVQDMENLEITTIREGRRIGQVPTAAPANIQLITNSVNEWFDHAQLTASAFDPILGKEQASGTTFRGQERTVAQGRGSHDRRRGQRAKFIEEIYRWDIIPRMIREITSGKKFMATLTGEELNWVADKIAENEVNKRIANAILDGKDPTNADKDLLKQIIRQNIVNSGNRQLLEILAGEFDDAEIKIGINVAGKQKDLAVLSDKILSIFQFVFANPMAFQQAMQIPALAKSFGDILEFSGMNQTDFSSLMSMVPSQPTQAPQAPQTPQPLTLNSPQPVQ